MSADIARLIAKSARQFTDLAERAAYLDRVCRGIARLRADVDRILAEEPHDAPVAEAPSEPEPGARPVAAQETRPEPASSVPADPSATSQENPGDTIGRYRLVKQLGEGGFGTVWLAEQFQPVRRQVALKIIKLGMDTAQVVTRFEQERQALALMDHPNVARVLDAGATASGRPYFVMDLVQGVPIQEYCDGARMPVAGRLELFAQVCAAVQHAHMKGIIHRDLKPSNVLVGTRDGKPRATVIDFGIAKATSARLTDRSMVTEAYQVIGTLQYMSPEQSQASPDIDTRTDVYSLGVILYELLAGNTPYDQAALEKGVLSEIMRMIAEDDPPPPSARITTTREQLPGLAQTRGADAKRLVAQVRGELDWIVMRSIEKDRARRYESAEALAADLRRYLAGEPVLAAPPSAAYRFRKLVRRNKGKVAAAAGIAAALVAGIVGFAWQASVAQGERDLAVKAKEAESVERRRAEEVTAILEAVFRGIDPSADETTAGTFKEQLVQSLDNVTGELSKSRDPLARARLEASFGAAYMALGDWGKAEKLYRSCWETRKRELGPDHADTETAALDLVGALEQGGKVEEALALAEPIRARRLASPDCTPAQRRRMDAELAYIHQHAERREEAIRLFESARDLWAADPSPDDDERLSVLHSLGAAYRQADRDEEAVAVLTDVRARRTALHGPAHPHTMMTVNSLAVALTKLKRNDEAAKLLEECRDRLLERMARDHPMVLAVEANLASVLDQGGRTADALVLMESVRQRSSARHGPDAMVSLEQSWGVAQILIRLGRKDDAVREMERFLPPLTALQGPDHAIVASIRRTLVATLLELDRPQEAVSFLGSLAAKAEETRGAEDRGTLRLRFEAADCLALTTEPAEGLRRMREILAVEKRVLGERDADTLATLHTIGVAHLSLGQTDLAVATLDEAHRGRLATLGPDHRATLESQNGLGSAYWAAHDLAKSVPTLEDALRRAEGAFGPDDALPARTALNLAANYRDAKRPDDLIDLLVVWLPRAAAAIGRGEPWVGEIADTMVAACDQRDRLADACFAMEVMFDGQRNEAGPDDPRVLRTQGNLGSCLWRAGKLDRSVPLFEDLVPRVRRVVGENDPQTLMACANLGVNLRDVRRFDESIALFEDVLRRAGSAGGEAAAARELAATEILRTLAQAGRPDELLARVRVRIEEVKARNAAGTTALASELVSLGVMLVDSGAHAAAEPLLREGVEVREKLAPDAWNTFNARAVLGDALAGLGRHAEAEPLVVSGSEGVLVREAKVPESAKPWVGKARERILRFYAAWDAADPGKGHDVQLTAWKARLEAPQQGTK